MRCETAMQKFCEESVNRVTVLSRRHDHSKTSHLPGAS